MEGGLQALYISPLKALANDIDRNLKQPLAEMEEIAAERGWEFPAVKVAVRSGDTSLSERAKMVRKPPHILLTTPERLGLLLSSKKFRQDCDGTTTRSGAAKVSTSSRTIRASCS